MRLSQFAAPRCCIGAPCGVQVAKLQRQKGGLLEGALVELKVKCSEKPHPCKNRKDGASNFKGKNPTAKAKSFRRISKREVSHEMLLRT
jgi:hypothetical protein